MTTRKTYDLPAPTTARSTCSAWKTSHCIEINGQLNNDGEVIHFPRWGIINLEIHEEDYLTLSYDDARQVGLALLAAVEQANTKPEDN